MRKNQGIFLDYQNQNMIRFFRLNVPQVRALLSLVLAIAFTFPTYAQEPDIDKREIPFQYELCGLSQA